MARHRTSSKRPPPEIGLHMECIEEELEPSQITYYTKGDKEFSEIQNKLEHYVKKLKAEVIEKGENCLVLQLNAMYVYVFALYLREALVEHNESPFLRSNSVSMGSQGQVSSGTTGSKGTRQSVQATQSYQQMVGQGILTRSTANSSANTFLVMDSGLSFMVGQMSPSNVTPEQTSATSTPKSVV